MFGFNALLVHGDLLVVDRWRWLKKYLPITRGDEMVVDVGCGTGAFTIGAAKRGYHCVGLSWDEKNQELAAERALICKVSEISFPILDVRKLDQRVDLLGQFEFAICCENIEHIIDDHKLMKDIAALLKPGGRLLLTAPFYFYRAITPKENGPFLNIEDGRHVRRGYTSAMLTELCDDAGLMVEEFGSCSGFFAQKITALMRILKPRIFSWGVVLPLRLLPPVLDKAIAYWCGWPDYSISLVAYKPRFKLNHPLETRMTTGT